MAGDAQVLLGKLLEPLVAGLQRRVVQGGVNVGGGTAQAGGSAEEVVVLVDVIVHDLALAAAALHGALRGVGLEQGAVVMDMVKGDKSCLQLRDFLSVMADPDEKMASVIVPDYQLSLAIGKEGQNARLAARLTGYKIDIKSETQAIESGELPEDYMEQMQMMEEGYEEYPEEGYDEYAEESYDDENAEEAVFHEIDE